VLDHSSFNPKMSIGWRGHPDVASQAPKRRICSLVNRHNGA
jgi:hypothetical protein